MCLCVCMHVHLCICVFFVCLCVSVCVFVCVWSVRVSFLSTVLFDVCISEYLSVVHESLLTNSQSCVDNIKQAVTELEKMMNTSDGRAKLKGMFK